MSDDQESEAEEEICVAEGRREVGCWEEDVREETLGECDCVRDSVGGSVAGEEERGNFCVGCVCQSCDVEFEEVEEG